MSFFILVILTIMKKVLFRGRLTILVEDDKITIFDSIQATMYAPYISDNDNLFAQMKDFLVTSESTEYCSWVDILELATVCKVKGMGVRKPNLTDIL